MVDNTKKARKEFTPITIEITIESRAEFLALYPKLNAIGIRLDGYFDTETKVPDLKH